ncbi:uncharacterized protein LOC111787787 [Cucurbita pepo subsp. pepo]|uniref:uncharacterized protein LOC111787787 n=1 Tax=Cucurbita pepo subsp. pepo TaxID=3664 RepID=UPI000C9D6D9E|nr:uncharacterized protein LOC111787787 [Cucurbita pepo subsp. pepo]
MNLKQEKLQLLGIYGVLKETFKLIFTAKTIFTQITLSFLLPLSFLIFTQTKIPNLWSIRSFPFNSALFFFSAVFFFLSTAATVFAAASTFADRELPFHQLLCVVPKIFAESALVEVGIRGILGIVWMCCFFMFLLIGTVLCLVCKSCHRERIDKLDLFLHLQQSLESKTEPLTLE